MSKVLSDWILLRHSNFGSKNFEDSGSKLRMLKVIYVFERGTRGDDLNCFKDIFMVCGFIALEER